MKKSITKYNIVTRPVAGGTYERSKHPKISIKFEQDDFDFVLKYAKRKQISFAASVRHAVKEFRKIHE